MKEWFAFDIQTLIWLFLVMFILHDFEEIIMAERWVQQHSQRIKEKFPPKLANRILNQFSMSTAQFAVAVLVVFLLVASSTLLASQYVTTGTFGNIHIFLVIMLVFFLHAFTHIAQSTFFQSVTPGVITSVIIVLPYSTLMIGSLLQQGWITWHTIFLCLPFVLVAVPVVLLAHWIGKKFI
ncbi:hypothetical protein QE429_000814 [Bacillus sp. SORGH_AS 510]|uniref:HXXEE domain-containing protein n=1 Tax=Bacillus sp. SORGH_AS_0510 TaxID=3041771 RepID=UPI00278923F3|nr:HXXEE domain-containing protein [Bacillus sp. SORGH_AS_0510]MDQ1143987.1 hypothetical protein [Bacillus sp. SORGH_AS_0510]